MSKYEPMSEHAIENNSNELARFKLLEAQAEIKRLTLDGLREIEWHERTRELEEGLAAIKTSCVPGSIWGHDLNQKSSPRGAARFREAHEAKVLERLSALEKQISELKTKGGGTPDCRRGDRRRQASGRREFDKSFDLLGWGRRAQPDRRKDNEE